MIHRPTTVRCIGACAASLLLIAMAASPGLCQGGPIPAPVFADPLEAETIPQWRAHSCAVEAATEGAAQGDACLRLTDQGALLELDELAAAAGIRVVHLRIGMVLSRAGGALARMLPPFRMGLGGRIGSGRQWVSWIAREDLLAIIERALTHDSWAGPVNAVAPGPVTNAEFTRTLARMLRRPAVLPLPASVVKLLFGEMGQCLLLEGARVRPGKLVADGFPFVYPDLESALRDELNP